MTSREAAIAELGLEAVAAYELVKGFYTRYGLELELRFALAVGGRRGRPGEPDVVTRLGGWEFQAAETTKNAAGRRAQLQLVGPGRIVQASGRLVPGAISGATFLRLHGLADPGRLAGELQVEAMRRAARAEQLQLQLGTMLSG